MRRISGRVSFLEEKGVLDRNEIDFTLFYRIPTRLLFRYWFIPLRWEGEILHVLVKKPLSAIDRMDLSEVLRVRMFEEVDAENRVETILFQYLYVRYHSPERIVPSLEEGSYSLEGSLENGERYIENVVNLIIGHGLEQRATDIHIESQKERIRVRLRVDGQLVEYYTLPKEIGNSILIRLKVMGKIELSEGTFSQDGRFSIVTQGEFVHVRLSILPTLFGEKIVMRLLPQREREISLSSLGFSQHNLERMEILQRHSSGLILMVGPTNSGKTTTLYGIMEQLKARSLNIVSIEDPVEYVVEGVNQISIEERKGISFLTALRAVLRQDPDVIVIGEIRDSETAKVAVDAAMAGRLVFASLHSNDSVGAVTRLIELGVPYYLVRDYLIGVVAQRLVRKKCSFCKSINYANKDEKRLFRRMKCSHCEGTGFHGRISLQEVLLMDDHMRELIGAETMSRAIKEHAQRGGMVLLKEDGNEKIALGLTTEAEVEQVTYRY